jgi:methylmalonyl-CoA mutase C-terminal domain/subunit
MSVAEWNDHGGPVMSEDKIRVLLTKIGIDSHDLGIRNLTLSLREGGMEVIYTGLRMPIESIPKVTIEEDVDVIGVSFLQGAHLALSPLLVKELKEAGLGDIPVIVGGIIPPKDIPKLKEKGIREVFLPGTRFEEIATYIKSLVELNR